MKPIYLDYNASTPVDPRVLAELLPFLREKYGNPSSSHPFGAACRAGIEEARERLARLLGSAVEELIFTSGATESNNTVIKGIARASGKGKHVITSRIEHPAILEPCRQLERFGYTVTYLQVDRFGMVDPQDLELAIGKDTVLVSIMHANNEVGTIEPIRELARVAASRGVLFHADAAQSVGKVRVRVDELGVDFLTVAGHKFGAPKGIGALYIRNGRSLPPLLHGAGHERGLRAGTENAAFIVGLGVAALLAQERIEAEGPRLFTLGQRLFDGLQKAGLSVRLNGHPTERLPNTWNISFAGFDATQVMAALPGVAVSPGAACHGDLVEPSPVLVAMGTDPAQARGAIRFSLGPETTEEEIDHVVHVLQENLR